MKRIVGHTIQIGSNPGSTTLECSCGKIFVRVDETGNEGGEKAFRKGRTDAVSHLEKVEAERAVAA